MNINYNTDTGLVPAIIQDANTQAVLMLGYMNADAYEQTVRTGLVTFYSRKRQQLWTKGETSGHTLTVVNISNDCDEDTLLIQAIPAGPTCHTGTNTCWGHDDRFTLLQLEKILQSRLAEDATDSYTASLVARGINKVAQKVGEEAVELVIEAKDDDADLFLGEAADLMYHYLVLLLAKGHTLQDVLTVLAERNSSTTKDV